MSFRPYSPLPTRAPDAPGHACLSRSGRSRAEARSYIDADRLSASPCRSGFPAATGSRVERGLTLIELTVALAIVAVLFAAAVIGIGSLTGSKARAAAGELGGAIRSLYDTASLEGRTCRLVFQLPPKGKDAGDVRYWAECAAGNVTTGKDRDEALQNADDEAERASREGNRRRALTRRSADAPESIEDQEAAEEARVDKLSRFSRFTSREIQPRKLAGVKISVWTEHQHEPVSSGLAYLYFWPQGYTEKADIWFTQGDNTWTITVAPLTGKTTVVGKALEVPRS